MKRICKTRTTKSERRDAGASGELEDEKKISCKRERETRVKSAAKIMQHQVNKCFLSLCVCVECPVARMFACERLLLLLLRLLLPILLPPLVSS